MDLNGELLRDLPALTQDRFLFFDSLFANVRVPAAAASAASALV